MLSDIQYKRLQDYTEAWEYKGLVLWIEREVEEDVIKKSHCYMQADGTERGMPLSPYAGVREMHQWVDAGCPRPANHGEWKPTKFS